MTAEWAWDPKLIIYYLPLFCALVCWVGEEDDDGVDDGLLAWEELLKEIGSTTKSGSGHQNRVYV